MSSFPPLELAQQVSPTVIEMIAQVLMVPTASVTPDISLVDAFGAESIDFIDLLFHLEDDLGLEIPVEMWRRFVADHVAQSAVASALTPRFVQTFADWRCTQATTSSL